MFADHGITVEGVLTDNGNGYRSHQWARPLRRARHRHTPHPALPPATNGKVERFNRTLADEWAYARVYRRNHDRSRALDRWLHTTTITAATPPSAANHP